MSILLFQQYCCTCRFNTLLQSTWGLHKQKDGYKANLNLLTTYDRDDNVDRLITNYLTIDRRGIDVTFRSYPNPRERRSDGGNGHKITRRHALQWLRNKFPQLQLPISMISINRGGNNFQDKPVVHRWWPFFYVFTFYFAFISIFLLVQSPSGLKECVEPACTTVLLE